MLRANIIAGIICAFALSTMIGDVTNCRALKGIGAASTAAPCPKVFCRVEGLEAFSSDFYLRSKAESGMMQEIKLTPEIYARLKGPYNRRNAYGAVLCFAPRLPAEIVDPVFEHALGPQGTLRRELGLPKDATEFTVVIQSKTGQQWEFTKNFAE